MRGYNNASEVTRLGATNAVKLIRSVYDSGIRQFDTADGYGTHFVIAEALKKYPRLSYTVFTKMWPYPRNGEPRANVPRTIERYLKELNTDYIDGVQLHCLRNGQWVPEMSDYMEAMDKLKQRGLIRSHGVSCHSLDAMKTAIDEPWVDVIHCRFNAFGDKMDGTVAEVTDVVRRLHDAGKGVIAMKLIGEGAFANDADKKRESFRYVLQSGYADALTVGIVKMSDLTDTVSHIQAITKS
jgi:aryl-alcohol dehydrogenase-like predicted oxidoreductase